MHIFDSIILGVVQGLTEFLPISSSGHLIIARDILGWNTANDLSFDAVLQVATVLALLVYFWKDIIRLIITFFALIFRKTVKHKDVTLIFAIIIATIPAVILGLFLEKYMDTVFRSAGLVALVLILGSIVMYFAEKFAEQNKNLNIAKGFWIGCFQCLALIPGFSRSGATISGGLFLGLNREDAARFSFLLSIPIIFGSGLKKLLDLFQSGYVVDSGMNLSIAFITAFVVGVLAISLLMKYLKNHSLKIFIWYRLVLAFSILAFLFLA